jgi:dihydrolipoamide dehydrogenase
MENFDVIILGGGPGGYVAAIRSAQLGEKTALIEKEHLGGICLNWGCIPTKSLLKSAELYRKMQNSEEYGIKADKVEFDINKIIERSRSISNKLVGGISGLLKKNKVTVIEGEGKFINSSEILVNEKTLIKGKNIIVATGARARVLQGFEPNGNNIWSYKDALMPKSTPKSMIVVGSGAMGIEFACFYNALGTDVIVLESADRILPVEDPEISAIARKGFEARGIKFKTGIKLLSQKPYEQGISLNFENNGNIEQLDAEILLMAVGIIGNTDNIGLDKTAVKIDRSHIVTNEFMQTSDKLIYAIGDVAGAPWLAHKASHEGIIAAESIAGKNPHKIIKTNIPGCTYSSPQIASVGLTEQAAIDAGYKIKVGRFPSYANAKALILGDDQGLTKTIFDAKTGEMLGAHMVGSDVTELIQGYVILKELEGTEVELMNTIFPHPTLSEMMHESVLQAFDRVIHI